MTNIKLLQQAESIPPSPLLKLMWFLKKKETLIATWSSFLKKLGKDLTGRESFSCSGATLIRSQRCQNDSAVVSYGHSKTPKRGNHAHLITPKLGSPSTYWTKPPQKDKLEFPVQPQTSETQPKLNIFLFPKEQVGSLSTWELWSVFPPAPAGVRFQCLGSRS